MRELEDLQNEEWRSSGRGRQGRRYGVHLGIRKQDPDTCHESLDRRERQWLECHTQRVARCASKLLARSRGGDDENTPAQPVEQSCNYLLRLCVGPMQVVDKQRK